MKSKHILIIILAMTLLCNCSPQKVNESSLKEDKEELTNAIERFNLAFREGDVDLLESMITDNYQHTNGNAKSIGKESWINYLQKRKKDIVSRSLVVNSYSMEETQIEMFDDMAIVTAKIRVNSTNNDQSSENEYRVTNIWVVEEGKWKRAGFHDGKIK